ncbi:MAG: type II secretion system F family protein [Nanoarchaeota archaeon]|nr:type II secretion system F family protein [Nanoarchaeota archaeon]
MKEETMLRMSRIFLPFGAFLSRFFPSVETNLTQLEIKLSPEEYLAMATFSVVFTFLLIFTPLMVIGTISRGVVEALKISLLSGGTIAFFVSIYSFFYLKLLLIKKIKLLEKDLLFALRYIYVKIKSGIPLYDAMVGVAYGDFGEVSKEFKKTIKEISAGIDEVTALENMALRNPSLYFRRIIWQITNNLRAGAEIADILEGITSTLTKEHKILIRKYGAELNPIILMYMMFTIVFPSLGITVIVVMSAFSELEAPLYIFYLIPFFVFILQIFFISIIRNKRPLLVI